MLNNDAVCKAHSCAGDHAPSGWFMVSDQKVLSHRPSPYCGVCRECHCCGFMYITRKEALSKANSFKRTSAWRRLTVDNAVPWQPCKVVDHADDAIMSICAMCSTVVLIMACTVVQAVVKAISQSNGKGQILTPWGSKTPERISIKLGIYNRVAGMPTHANPCGAATTWVVWANT